MKSPQSIPMVLVLITALFGAACMTPDGSGAGALDRAIASDVRSAEEKARDPHRHPSGTLRFLGLAPGQTVVEITPGSGWYTKIIAPYLKETGGTYYAAGFDPNTDNKYLRDLYTGFEKDIVAKPELFGAVKTSVFGSDDGVAPAGSADLVLTFRNVHNWVPRGMGEKAFADFYRALKPGGVLGVVDHRLPANAARPEKLVTGYIHESEVIALAEGAGFKFVAGSNVNNNAADTADHPFGVWTLPPSLRNAARGEDPNPDFDQTKYKAIGESDRFTLKFRKPS